MNTTIDDILGLSRQDKRELEATNAKIETVKEVDVREERMPKIRPGLIELQDLSEYQPLDLGSVFSSLGLVWMRLYERFSKTSLFEERIIVDLEEKLLKTDPRPAV